MSKIKIITDSASDISAENESRFAIRVIPFKVALGSDSYISRVDFDNEQFYTMMGKYDGIPVTSQITPFEFEEIFSDYYNQGFTDVIYISINSEGSATYGNSVMAKNSFFDNNPQAAGEYNIYCIDSRTYTGAYGYAVVKSAQMAMDGKSADEIVEFANDWLEKCTIFFAPYTLKYAKKSGRIPSAVAFVGDALGLCPIMKIFDHKITTFSKARGRASVVPSVADCVMKEIEKGSDYCIVYGDDKQVRDDMAQEMTKRLGYPPSDFYQIGAAIAANAGPTVSGVIFRSKI